MKFSSCGWWFGGDWYENVTEAKKCGFSALENLSWANLDLNKAVEFLKREEMVNSALLIESTDKDLKCFLEWEHGMVYEDSREPFLKSFTETVKACELLKVPNIVATSGNERFDIEREKQVEMVADLLSEFGKIAEQSGISVVFEPLNVLVDHEGYLISKSSEAFELIKRVDSPAVKVLFDIYHQQITEGNVIRNITENIDLIGHFHIGDNPGRHEPGTGELNYTNIFSAIKNTGYDGYLAFECSPSADAHTVARKMSEFIAPFES